MLHSPTGEYNKTEMSKIVARRFVEVTDKEISEIKINSVPKNTKDLCINTKTIIRLRPGDYIGAYSLRLRLGEYSPIISPCLQ